ncbi:hypothetical protein Droror1_Dr00016583 [Drosera rotundifolia]
MPGEAVLATHVVKNRIGYSKQEMSGNEKETGRCYSSIPRPTDKGETTSDRGLEGADAGWVKGRVLISRSPPPCAAITMTCPQRRRTDPDPAASDTVPSKLPCAPPPRSCLTSMPSS